MPVSNMRLSPLFFGTFRRPSHSAASRFRVFTCAGLALLLALCGGLTPAHGQRFALQESLLGGSGATATTGPTTITSSLGGPGPAGRAASDSFVLYSGFPSPFAGVLVVRIRHDPSAPADGVPAGSDRTINAEIQTVQAPLAEATLTYRAGDAEAPTSVPMTEEDEGFVGLIPGDAITERGVVYVITATDANGQSVRAPRTGVFSFPVQIGAPGLVRPDPLPGGGDQSAYRLISAPLQIDRPNPADVLGDDISFLADGSTYDPEQARFFEPIGTRVAEFPRTADFSPGKAFWLIVRDGASDLDTGPGSAFALNSPVSVDLDAGWNFVGNPFALPLPVANATAASGQPLVYRSYGSDGYNTPTEPVAVLEPFEGYAVFAERATTLRFEPPLQDAEKSAPARTENPFAWSLRIRGIGPTGRDADNLVGVHPEASPGPDAWDWPDPPPVGAGFSLGFVDLDPAAADRRFSSDVRPSMERGATWVLAVRTAATGPVDLQVDGLDDLPARAEVWLTDLQTKARWNLRERASVRLPAIAAETPRRLQLAVGSPKYVEATQRAAGALPTEFLLDPPYPNPSRGPATIRFGLPETAAVTIDVYDALGRRIAVLADGREHRAGYHTVTWDRRVGSGMYFIRMQAGPYRATQKLVRVR